MKNKTQAVLTTIFVTIFLITPSIVYAVPGDLDPTFSVDGRLTDGEGRSSDVAIQPDGRIVVTNGLIIARYIIWRRHGKSLCQPWFRGRGIHCRLRRQP